MHNYTKGGEVIWVDDKCSVGNLSTTSNIIPAAALHADKTEASLIYYGAPMLAEDTPLHTAFSREPS
jgi:hypothetical protein